MKHQMTDREKHEKFKAELYKRAYAQGVIHEKEDANEQEHDS